MLINYIKSFFKKDLVIKLILLIMLFLIVYYLFIAWLRADEVGTMIRSKLMSWWYRPFIDFCESHWQMLRDLMSWMFKLWIKSKIFVIGIRLIAFVAYMIIIYKLIKQFAKKDNLLFATNTKIEIIPILFISSIMWFIVSYSAILTDTFMLLLCPLWLYFLVKWGKKNHIIAWLIFALSIIAIQKSLFVIPLLYILSLEKNFLKNYKQVLVNRFISFLSILLFWFLYVAIRYSSYTANELRIVKEAMFNLERYTQLPYNIFYRLTSFASGGWNNLSYMFTWIILMFLSKRKAAITITVYMITQLAWLAYILNVMPLIIVRYFFPFLILTPIFFHYQWLKKRAIIKYIMLFAAFMLTYMAMIFSDQRNKLRMDNCDETYKIFNTNYDNNIPMFYDSYCFRQEFDSDILLKKFKQDNTLIPTHAFDYDWRITYNLPFNDVQKLPHLKYKFATDPKEIEISLRKYDHLYTVFSGCNNIVKIWTYDDMLKDFKQSFPAITCVPFVRTTMVLLDSIIK